MLAASASQRSRPEHEGDGDEVFFHFQAVRQEAALPVYRDLLRALPRRTRVRAAVSSNEQEVALRVGLGPLAERHPAFDLIHVRGPLGPWVRDRYIPFVRDGQRCLYAPAAQFVPPHEAASLQVPAQLRARDSRLKLVVAPLNLEGGDVLLGDRTVFIGETSVRRNAGWSVHGRAAFRKEAEALFGRKLIIVGEGAESQPYDHIDMFLTVLDDSTLLLGDPTLAMNILFMGKPVPRVLMEGPLGRFLRGTQEKMTPLYERIERELSDAGFRVLRLPCLHGERFADGRRGAVVNWNNALVDRPGARAYIPSYGLSALDGHAAGVWRGQGYTVYPIDTREAIVRGGGVRCLTNAFFHSP